MQIHPSINKSCVFPSLLLGLILLFSYATADAAESFRWLDNKNAMHTLEEYKGTPVLLHIWASWCGPCRQEMPEMASWMQSHPNITLIPVSVDDSKDDAVQFLRARGLDLPMLLTDGREAASLGVRVLPTTLVISGNGTVQRRLMGQQAWGSQAFSKALNMDMNPATSRK